MMDLNTIECASSSDGLEDEEIQSQITHQFSSKPHNNMHGLPPATSVHELLECPVCTNSMYPPIHQSFKTKLDPILMEKFEESSSSNPDKVAVFEKLMDKIEGLFQDPRFMDQLSQRLATQQKKPNANGDDDSDEGDE
ncbi:hypothetical protein R6Q57_021251 [Mikania cordata]